MTSWGVLLHVGFNMWEDSPEPRGVALQPGRGHRTLRDYLQCDDALWAELTAEAAGAGLNMVVMDLGDAVRYESHPEIAVRDAWSTDRLREELARLRDLGLEPIPKLNFSAAHHAWLREYSRQVSTPAYYRVCGELIAEVSSLFDTPRLFHIGMDEEDADHQRSRLYTVIRQHELWWHDLDFFCEQVAGAGSRAWMWSDKAWHQPEEFYEKARRSVLQSNWYYRTGFGTVSEEGRPRAVEERDDASLTYLDLDDHGYDQIPTGSNHASPDNFEQTVEFCGRRLQPERLLGFLQTPWKPTIPEFRDHHLQAIDQVRRAIEKHTAARDA